MFRFLVSLHFPQILILSGLGHLFWRLGGPDSPITIHTPFSRPSNMCAQRICGLKVCSKHTNCVICKYFGKQVTTIYYLHLTTISHKYTPYNYLLFTISYLNTVGRYSCKYLHLTRSNWWRSMAAKISLKSPRKGRRPALHRPTYVDCRFAHNFRFDYLYAWLYK